MPNGRVAAEASAMQRFAAFVIREVRALTGDVEPVGRNERVTLNFLRTDGVVEPDKSFNFTDDTGSYQNVFIPEGFTVDGPGGRFYVSVGSGSTLTRAFVCTSVEATDIWFNSEAAFRLILDEVNSNPLVRLDDYSAAEICEIVQAIVELPGFVPGNNAAEVNDNATALAADDDRIIDLIQRLGGAQPTPTSGTAVPTSTRTNTAVPTDTPTNTPVTPVEATATPTEMGETTPTATNTPNPPGLRIDVGNGGVNASNQVVIDVSLFSDGNAVGGMQNDVIFDNSIINLPSAASCRINPEIGLFPGGSSCLDDPSIGACKNLSSVLTQCGGSPQPQGCPAGAGTNISVFRGIIAATAAPNDNEIPDGVLYTCTFSVVNAAGLPTVLTNSNIVVSDPLGERIEPVGGSDGLATVAATAAAFSEAGSSIIFLTDAGSFPATGFIIVDNQIVGFTKQGNNLNLDEPLNQNVDTGETVLLGMEPDVEPTATPTAPAPTDTPASGDTPTVVIDTPTVPPTATNTPPTVIPPTSTNTPQTPVLTATPTNTPVTPTATNTPPTPVITSTPTNTPVTPTATNTPVTPTATNTNTPVTPTATMQPTPAEGPALNIGSVTGSAGSSVVVPVSLSKGGGNIVAVSVDIIYNATQVQIGLEGEGPECFIHPSIGAGTTADKELLLSVLEDGGDNEILRVGVIGLDNANVLPDGVLFLCNFDISGGAGAGPKVLLNSPMASNAAGAAVAIGGTNGVIDVVSGGPSINVGSTAGSPGSIVTVPVSLANGGGGLATASTDMTFDASQLSVVMVEGEPDCFINPAIGEGSAADKMLLLSVLDAGGGNQTLRVGVIGFDNANPLPDGSLFACNVRIDAAASAGAKTLNNTPDASDAGGQRVIVGGASGSVTVL
jgi:hypothetical protein